MVLYKDRANLTNLIRFRFRSIALKVHFFLYAFFAENMMASSYSFFKT